MQITYLKMIPTCNHILLIPYYQVLLLHQNQNHQNYLHRPSSSSFYWYMYLSSFPCSIFSVYLGNRKLDYPFVSIRGRGGMKIRETACKLRKSQLRSSFNGITFNRTYCELHIGVFQRVGGVTLRRDSLKAVLLKFTIFRIIIKDGHNYKDQEWACGYFPNYN